MRGASQLNLPQEKSWSVKLVNGYVLNGQVKGEKCRDCESTPKLVAGNNSDPDLLLYGCYGHRCRHFLIRTKVSEAYPLVSIPNIAILEPFTIDFSGAFVKNLT